MKLKSRFLVLLRHPLVLLASRWLLGGVFIWASIDKIVHPRQFAEIVSGYGLLPAILVPFFAVVLPFAELVCGIFLLFNMMTRSAALIVIGMLMVFLVAIAFNVFRGVAFDCGCFSTAAGSGESPWLLLLRDLLLLIPAGISFFYSPRRNPDEAFIIRRTQ
jgi:uncharacterized membrane protein YphA (DoxX/SURF4 family)